MAHRTLGWITYNPSYSAFGSFSIKADQTTAGNNGVSVSSSPPFQNFWPLHRSDMRAVYGRDAAAKVNDSCVCISTANPLFALGSSFLDFFGNSYVVTGLRQERFRTRNLK